MSDGLFDVDEIPTTAETDAEELERLEALAEQDEQRECSNCAKPIRPARPIDHIYNEWVHVETNAFACSGDPWDFWINRSTCPRAIPRSDG